MKEQSRRDFLRNLTLGVTTLAAQPLLTSCGVKPGVTSQPSTGSQSQTGETPVPIEETLAPTP